MIEKIADIYYSITKQIDNLWFRTFNIRGGNSKHITWADDNYIKILPLKHILETKIEKKENNIYSLEITTKKQTYHISFHKKNAMPIIRRIMGSDLNLKPLKKSEKNND